ncbi:FKBP-type peptidyl-prolyl cis-trans isomerase [Mucilaginibacter sp. SG564]|uniref:FKBP-type peptidyl-prolyl cis-trans isomerase n=1 Tax=unclassified Mucilaginibacter TaxID=2617802 RepID=UPI0015518C0F|nr:FKBP-type peptidyl-prolyl cis-trans isomerase [Mucilaginibacter sp. SG564]NOW98595.1 FKBP-type peptidyl-prolyl cis-trans isomerase [Mucilaginibacter sp. SG564]
MKQTLFTLLLITSIGLISCRKTRNDPNIVQYDQTQIQNYISANGLTNMKRDVSNGDTSGIYYQILSQGSTTTPLDYPDSVAFVLTVRSFDGKYVNADTLNLAHFDGLLGHISGGGPVLGFTKGLQYAIHDIIKYKGTRARILVPSRVAYGVNGIGTGSSSNTGTRILGNQCLDYYVNVISDVNVYDRYLINEYITKNNLSGFNEVKSGRAQGLYYKVVTPGTGTDPLSEASSFTSNYTGKVLNGGIFGSTATDSGTSGTTTLSSFTLGQLIVGVQEALKGQTAGAVVSMLIPSRLGYGKSGSGTTIGPDVPLYYDFTIGTVTNP